MFLLRLFLLLPHALALVSAQQVGWASSFPNSTPNSVLTLPRSFFTAIYINGVPASSSQISCADMGQPNYCCGLGQFCAWDDAGKVACCASGSTCSGSAYGAGASAGAWQYQYYSSPTSYYQQEQTTTVYQSQSQGCNCESTTNYGNGNVVPILPVTVATVLTPVAPTTTSYYTPPTVTYYPSTITTTPVAEVVTTTNGACPGGYTTLTEANVGASVRTVGCQVIFESGARRGRSGGRG